jgi:biopolymer transport protein ExbB/TolQ
MSIWIHTLFFLLAFIIGIAGLFTWEFILLVLTTIVSLEAIYLALFIQMSVNRNTDSLREVEEDIEEIEEDLEEITEEDKAEEARERAQAEKIDALALQMQDIINKIESLKK